NSDRRSNHLQWNSRPGRRPWRKLKGAICESSSGDVNDTGTGGSICDAKSDGTGKATAIAHNTSTSDSLVANNGKARAVARNNSFSEAEAHADCEAKSNARHDGEAITFCFKDAPGSRGKGKKSAITSRAIGRLGGAAESESDEDCTSFSRAIG